MVVVVVGGVVLLLLLLGVTPGKSCGDGVVPLLDMNPVLLMVFIVAPGGTGAGNFVHKDHTVCNPMYNHVYEHQTFFNKHHDTYFPIGSFNCPGM